MILRILNRDKPTFEELLLENYPTLRSIVSYEKEIGHPNEVYICTEEFSPSERQKEKIKEKFAEKKYLMARGDYIIPHHFFTNHGPIYVEDNEREDGVVEVSKDSIKLVSGKFGKITQVKEEYEFSYDEVKEILVDIFKEEVEKKTYPGENRIEIHVDNTRLTFLIHDHQIRYNYIHAVNGFVSRGQLFVLTFKELERIFESSFIQNVYLCTPVFLYCLRVC